MKIQNPFQATTPLGQGISNLGAALLSGPTPAEAEQARLTNALLRARTADANNSAADAAAIRNAQVDLGTLFGQVPVQRRATSAPVADPGVAGPARARAATAAENTRSGARQFFDDLPANIATAGAPLISSTGDLGDMFRFIAANSPGFSDNDVVRAMAGAGNAIGVNEAVSLPGQDRVRAANLAGDISQDAARIAATPLTESQVKGGILAGQPADVRNLTVGPTFAQVRGGAAQNAIAASNGQTPPVSQDERTIALGAQAFGAPLVEVADPLSPSGITLTPRTDAAGQPGVPPSASNATDVTGATAAVRGAAQKGLGDIGTTRSLISEVEQLLDPSFFGATGFINKTVQNAAQQGSALGEFLNGQGAGLRNKVTGDNLTMVLEDQLDPALFDPNLPAFQFLKNLLVYRLALINNPDGRISTPDFNNAERNLGGQTGLFSLANEAQFRGNLRAFGLLLDSEERKFDAQLQGNFAGSAQAPAASAVPPPPPGFVVVN